MGWMGVITDAGQALLDQWTLGGHVLTVTNATVGSGYVAEENMRAATALSNGKNYAQIVSSEAISDGTRFKIQVGPTGGTAYIAHEIGLWARLDDGAETLLALHQDIKGGVSIPTRSESPDFAFAIYLVHSISNDGSLSVTVNPSAYVSQSTLTAAVAKQDRRHLWYADTSAPDQDAYDADPEGTEETSIRDLFGQMALAIVPQMISAGETYEECVISFVTPYTEFTGTCSIHISQEEFYSSMRWTAEIGYLLSGRNVFVFHGRYHAVFNAAVAAIDSQGFWNRRLAERKEAKGFAYVDGDVPGCSIGVYNTVRQSGNACSVQVSVGFTTIQSPETAEDWFSRDIFRAVGISFPAETVSGIYMSYPSNTIGRAILDTNGHVKFSNVFPAVGDNSALVMIGYIAED